MNRYYLFTLISAVSCHNAMAADDMASQSKHGDRCVQSCVDYYNDKKTLVNFTYYKNDFQPLEGKETNKSQYCRDARLSLDVCYSQDSKLYGWCKDTARWVTRFVTNNQSIQDWLASCKATCSDDLVAFCSSPPSEGDASEVARPPQESKSTNAMFAWLSTIHPKSQYKVIFLGYPFRTQIMTGQEILDLPEEEQGTISKTIELQRVQLAAGSGVYINLADTYKVVYADDHGTSDQLTGDEIINSGQKFLSITK